jgi:adenosine deaminase CECR1
MIGSESMSLYGWKQLAKWSLEHSCMNEVEMREVTLVWEAKWVEFCKWIVEIYSPMFADAAMVNTTDSTNNASTTNNSHP